MLDGPLKVIKDFSLFGLVQRRLLRVIIDVKGIYSYTLVHCTIAILAPTAPRAVIQPYSNFDLL